MLALTGAAVSLGLAGAVAAPASPASAEACPSGSLCAYVQTNYQGDQQQVSGNNSNLLQYGNFDNAASVINKGTQCSVTLWNRTGYQGTSVNLPRGTGYTNLETQNPPFYKNVASNRWC